MSRSPASPLVKEASCDQQKDYRLVGGQAMLLEQLRANEQGAEECSGQQDEGGPAQPPQQIHLKVVFTCLILF